MCVSLWHSNKGQRERNIIPCDIQKPNLYQLFLEVILPQLGVSCARPKALAYWMRTQQHRGLRLPSGTFTTVSSSHSFVPLLSIYPVMCIMPGHSRAMFPDLSKDNIPLWGASLVAQWIPRKIPHAAAQLSTCAILLSLNAARLELTLSNKKSHCNEKPMHRDKGRPLLATARENPSIATKAQHNQK